MADTVGSQMVSFYVRLVFFLFCVCLQRKYRFGALCAQMLLGLISMMLKLLHLLSRIHLGIVVSQRPWLWLAWFLIWLPYFYVTDTPEETFWSLYWSAIVMSILLMVVLLMIICYVWDDVVYRWHKTSAILTAQATSVSLDPTGQLVQSILSHLYL